MLSKILTGRPPSASLLVKSWVLSISQNLTEKSSPAAKNLFFVVSNCTTPNDRFLKPWYVLFTAPSLSFHSTMWDSPSLLVPQEKSLNEKTTSLIYPVTRSQCINHYHHFAQYILPCSISTVGHGCAPTARGIIVNSRSQIVIQPCFNLSI